MKNTKIYIVLIFSFFSISSICFCQSQLSIKEIISNKSLQDSVKARMLIDIGFDLRRNYPDSSILIAEKALPFINKNNPNLLIRQQSLLARCYNNIGLGFMNSKNNAKAIENFNLAIDYGTKSNDLIALKASLFNIGTLFFLQGDYPKALECYLKAVPYIERSGIGENMASLNMNIGMAYSRNGNFDKVEFLPLTGQKS